MKKTSTAAFAAASTLALTLAGLLTVPASSAEVSDDALVENTQLQVADSEPVEEDAVDNGLPSDISKDGYAEDYVDVVGTHTADDGDDENGEEPSDERDPLDVTFPAGITRLSGANRYDTAARVADKYPSGVRTVFVATGSTFPDALSAASAAAYMESPILLTEKSKLPWET